MQTYEQFAAKHGVELTHTPTGKRPLPGHPSVKQDTYTCTLIVNGFTFNFPYAKGEGLKGEPPTVDECLQCLALDASSAKENSFEEFCREFGYNDDSIKDRGIYEACVETLMGLERLFGQDVLNELLYETNEEGE